MKPILKNASEELANYDRNYQPEDTFWFFLRMLTMQDLLRRKENLEFIDKRPGKSSDN